MADQTLRLPALGCRPWLARDFSADSIAGLSVIRLGRVSSYAEAMTNIHVWCCRVQSLALEMVVSCPVQTAICHVAESDGLIFGRHTSEWHALCTRLIIVRLVTASSRAQCSVLSTQVVIATWVQLCILWQVRSNSAINPVNLSLLSLLSDQQR